MIPKLERALADAVDALEGLGLRYAVVGGLAVGAWATPRATRDVDLYAELPSVARAPFARELRARGFDVPAMEQELERFGVFRSRSRDGVFLDVFDSTGPLGETILARRREASIGARSLWVVAPEDLALLKAFSDRERDFDDLVMLLTRARPVIDMAYVDSWAKRLDESLGSDEVSSRLRRAQQAGRAPRARTKRKRGEAP